MKDTTDSGRDLFLPVEIITEILSWLPGNSVLRFKCVCKLWLSITQDPEYIHKHMTHGEYISAAKEGYRHYIIMFYRGLVLEKRGLKSKYRLRNPITKRVLYLPDPDEEGSTRMLPSYVSRTRIFKMVFPFANRIDGNGSFKVLTAGVDDAWRTLDFPFTCKLTNVKWLSRMIERLGLYIIIVLPKTEDVKHCKPAIVCMEVESEKLWKISVPRHFFSDWSNILHLTWVGKLSLASKVQNGDELHVWVVEDYKNQKWAEEKIIIDLTSVKDLSSYYELWMFHPYQDKYLKFDIVSKVVTHRDGPTLGKLNRFRSRPSLIDLKGMKPLGENRTFMSY